MPDKKTLSERDIGTKYITPALQQSGLTARGKRKRAGYILYYNSNPVAIIEAKDNNLK
jgi:type I restriction enzyme, R subunit